MTCAAVGWGMYPTRVQGDTMQCPLCASPTSVGWMTVAGRQVRLIKDHDPCR